MIKLITFQKRVDSLTRSQFEDRWRTIHGPIAAAFPGLRGYMLGFSLDPDEPPADGIAQLWFDSREACQESYASEIGRSGSADASAWLARREHLLATETWLKRRGPVDRTPFKVVLCVKRRASEPRAGFIAWLRETVTPALLDELGSPRQSRLSLDEAGLMLNSRSAGALSLVAGEAPYDALIETWFDERAAASAARARLDAWADAEEARIARHESALLTEHVVVKPPLSAFGDEKDMR